MAVGVGDGIFVGVGIRGLRRASHLELRYSSILAPCGVLVLIIIVGRYVEAAGSAEGGRKGVHGVVRGFGPN